MWDWLPFFCRPFLGDGMSSFAMVDQGCLGTGLSRLDFSSGGRRHITE
jgi:hypothetical protein